MISFYRKLSDMEDEGITIRDYDGRIMVGKYSYYNPGVRIITSDFMCRIELSVSPELNPSLLYEITIDGIRSQWNSIAKVKCLLKGDIKKRLFIHEIVIEDERPSLLIRGRWDNKNIPFRVYAYLLSY